MDKSKLELTAYRNSDDSWWSMTDEYYKLLGRLKASFMDHYISKDADSLLSVVELEWLHIKHKFINDEKYKSQVDEINALFGHVRFVMSEKVLSNSKLSESIVNRNSKAIGILKDLEALFYLLEADKGMLERKPEDMLSNLRKYGD